MIIGVTLAWALGASLLGNGLRLIILKVFDRAYNETLLYFIAMWLGLALALFIILNGPVPIGK